ncbi:unnamed protein product [Arctogadus glacialis]
MFEVKTAELKGRWGAAPPPATARRAPGKRATSAGVYTSRCSGGLRCYPLTRLGATAGAAGAGPGAVGPQMDPEPPTGSPDAPREHASSGQ